MLRIAGNKLMSPWGNGSPEGFRPSDTGSLPVGGT